MSEIDDRVTFGELLPKEKGEVKSLREFLREERQREGRTGKEDWIKGMIKRGGSPGQFSE